MSEQAVDSCLKRLGEGYGGPAEATAQDMLAALRTVIVDGAIYASTPITTGEAYLRLLESEGVLHPTKEQLRAAVVEPNLEEASLFISSLRDQFPGSIVIDPTALEDRADWEQYHYHSFWIAVIDEFATHVYVRDGWQFSSGCVLEVLRAFQLGLPVLLESRERLRCEVAADLIGLAHSRFSRLGIDRPTHASAVKLLSGLSHVAPE